MMLTNAHARHLASLLARVGQRQFARLLIAGLRRSLDCNTVAIIAFSKRTGATILDSWVEDPALDRVFRDVYVNGAFRLDPFYQEGLRAQRPQFLRLKDIAPDRFFTTEYFRRYYRRTAFSDEMGFIMPYGEGIALHLSVSRRGTDQRFSGRERRALEASAPLLAVMLKRHYGVPAESADVASDLVPIATRLEAHARKHLNADLTPREALVLQHVLEGYSNVAIGLLIDVSPLTVKVHRRNAYRKLGISSQAELFAAFIPALAPSGKGVLS
ncbi:MAG: LuxR C-terminal-related transcriptional regulator [Hyphomonas sp.]|nr:LuxR C-terminal-related transcriptional regulator [Hyphomonas sp.]